MKIRTFAVLASAGLLLASCSNNTASEAPSTAGPAASSESENAPEGSTNILEAYGYENLNAHELIDTLDALPVAERPTDFVASVRPNELLITDAAGTETSLPIDADEFYLSFSPFVESSHECYFHSLTTCRGEMSQQAIHVLIVDKSTNAAIVDEDVTTFDNGFYGVWLPRDLDATLTVTNADGLTGTVDVSTSTDEDKTCETTLKLS